MSVLDKLRSDRDFLARKHRQKEAELFDLEFELKRANDAYNAEVLRLDATKPEVLEGQLEIGGVR